MVYDRGSTITVEVYFYKHVAFGSDTLFDPSTYTITVYQPGETAQVDAASLSKSAVGKYFYYVQTTSSWPRGDYWITINSGDGSYDDVTDEKAFTLE